MLKIEETEEEEEEIVESKHSTMKPSSSLSSAPPPPPESSDSVSSISSDHTFHGFSPIRETLPSPSPIHQLENLPSPVHPPVPSVANRLVRDQPESMIKTESDAETGFAETGVDDERVVVKRRDRKSLVIMKMASKARSLRRAGLGFRVCEFVVCLISLSVLGSDKNRGWALDSFDRYIEFRYALSVNVIGFAYSGLQGLDLLYQLTAGKDLSQSKLRYGIDFAMDQILAYLLLSASTSAFTRVDDWISNWGQDKFPAMASASVGISFVAFVAFAFSSLISGYILCTHKFT